MRKNITFKICGAEIVVPVTFDTIERIERSFGANADTIASIILPNMQTVAYSRLARAVCDVTFGYTELKREEICEYIIAAPGREIAQFGLNLQIACLYLRKEIDEESFDAYARGESPPKKTTGTA